MITASNRRTSSKIIFRPSTETLLPLLSTRTTAQMSGRFGGIEIPNIGLNAVAGRPPEEYGIDPTSFGELRKATYDIHARIDDMNAGGILGSMNFPSFPGFAGRVFSAAGIDRDDALIVLQAYNDWHIDEWCGNLSGAHDPPVPGTTLGWRIWPRREVSRCRPRVATSSAFRKIPNHWVTRASIANVGIRCGGLVLRLGPSSACILVHQVRSAPPQRDSPIDVMMTLTPVNIIKCATDLVWSHVLRGFPDLRVALSEGGIGWVPYFMDRIDTVYRIHSPWTGQDYRKRKPSEIFQRADHPVLHPGSARPGYA